MNLYSNNYFILASSQYFPFTTSLHPTENTDSSVDQAKYAYLLVQKEKYDEAAEAYNQAIANYPEQAFFYACRSILHRYNGDDESAFYDYQIAKRIDFNYHHLLEWMENHGDMQESQELVELDNEIKSQTDNPQLYINRALLQVQHFNYLEAIDDYTKAYNINGNMDVLISRAAIFMRLLQYDKALDDLNTVILQSEKLEAYLYRAKLYTSIREYDVAKLDFEKALIIDSNNSNICEERAQMYEQMDDFDHAIADYSTIIALNPEDFYAYVLRADAYEKIENWDYAISDYTEAIRLNPYYSDLYQYRAVLKEKMGDAEGAANDFAKFEELEDDD